MKKVYVVNKAVMIPGHGTRSPGEFFEMGDAESKQYKAHPNLSMTAPKKAKQEPEPQPEQTESDEDNES